MYSTCWRVHVCFLSSGLSVAVKKASAVIDGGDSLEATHQGDAIARVGACLCLYRRVSLCVLERKRVMLSYVS